MRASMRMDAGLRLCFLVALLAQTGCRSATQIELHLRTNVPCKDSWQGVAIYTGASAFDVQNKAPSVTTSACSADGNIGSLVIVPSQSNDAAIFVDVVAGIARSPETCAATGYQGCIVSRLSLRFLPHQSLAVSVDLAASCLGLACDASHSCIDGSCVATGTLSSDASVTTGAVRCGDNGVRCEATGEVCCLRVDEDAGTTNGDCRAPEDCDTSNLVLNCDDNNDCPKNTPDPLICCVEEEPVSRLRLAGANCVTAKECLAVNFVSDELCQDQSPCTDATQMCQAYSRLPGYFACTLVSP